MTMVWTTVGGVAGIQLLKAGAFPESRAMGQSAQYGSLIFSTAVELWMMAEDMVGGLVR
jgi:hypothetical protein